MKTTQIGTSAFVGSQIALGIMRADSHPVSEIAKLLQFAVDRGINFFLITPIFMAAASAKKSSAPRCAKPALRGTR